jgi:uncharacterized protein (DUF2147 family)
MSDTLKKLASAATRTAFAAAALAAVGTSASAGDAPDVAGYWVSENKQEVVEIKPCTEGSSRLCGALVWAQGEDADVTVLRGFRASRGMYTKGKVIDAESGKKRDGRLEMLDDGTLKVSSCKRNLCRHEVWARPAADMAEVPAQYRGAGR